MSGVSIQVFTKGLDDALRLIDRLDDLDRRFELMDGIGRLVQEQTRRRIASEKTSPDGAAWKPNWKGSSILKESGALEDSVDYFASENSVEVGTGLVYARIHQEGGVISAKNAKALSFMMGNRFVQVKSVTMPARPYLGLSTDNQADVLDAAEDWVRRLIQ